MPEVKINHPDIYVTQGKYFGRVLRCNAPFFLDNANYHISKDLNDWDQLSGPRLSTEQLQDCIEEISEMRRQSLRDIVAENADNNYILLDYGDGRYAIMQIKDTKLSSQNEHSKIEITVSYGMP